MVQLLPRRSSGHENAWFHAHRAPHRGGDHRDPRGHRGANFLEAQTRSKVSRVKADIRSVVTALEAYYVDWNNYPTNLR